METMQEDPVADGQQPMTRLDVVCKVLCISQGKVPPREAAIAFFLKNAGIYTSSTRAETLVERTLWEQHAAEQESSATLVDQVDELKSKTEKTEREFEQYKKQQQEEYNNLRELCMHFSSSSNSQCSTPMA